VGLARRHRAARLAHARVSSSFACLPAFLISLAVATPVVRSTLGIAAATIPLSSGIAGRRTLAPAGMPSAALNRLVGTSHLLAVALTRFVDATPVPVINDTIVSESDSPRAVRVQVHIRRGAVPAAMSWSALRGKHCTAPPIDPDAMPIEAPGGALSAGGTAQLLHQVDAAGSIHAAIGPVPASGLTGDPVRQCHGGKQHERDC